MGAARAAGGRRDRRSRNPRTTRRDDGDRAGSRRARRSARQCHCGTEMSKMSTALILGDLQNDFLHPDGAYGRAGQSDRSIAALPARLAPLVRLARERGILIVATLFTLVPG